MPSKFLFHRFGLIELNKGSDPNVESSTLVFKELDRSIFLSFTRLSPLLVYLLLYKIESILSFSDSLLDTELLDSDFSNVKSGSVISDPASDSTFNVESDEESELLDSEWKDSFL